MHVLSASTLSGNSNEIVLHTNAFARMNKLRLLQLSHVQFKGSYKELPKELRWLSWLGFPLKSIASDFPLEFLVYVEMHQSNLTQVFNRKTDLRQVLKGRKVCYSRLMHSFVKRCFMINLIFLRIKLKTLFVFFSFFHSTFPH